MSLSSLQWEFLQALSKLIEFAKSEGYKLTGGDLYATTGHIDGSQHYKRLAIDLNLFINNQYKTDTESHRKLGEYWVTLHPLARWGGNFTRKDGNHYEFFEE